MPDATLTVATYASGRPVGARGTFVVLLAVAFGIAWQVSWSNVEGAESYRWIPVTFGAIAIWAAVFHLGAIQLSILNTDQGTFVRKICVVTPAWAINTQTLPVESSLHVLLFRSRSFLSSLGLRSHPYAVALEYDGGPEGHIFSQHTSIEPARDAANRVADLLGVPIQEDLDTGSARVDDIPAIANPTEADSIAIDQNDCAVLKAKPPLGGPAGILVLAVAGVAWTVVTTALLVEWGNDARWIAVTLLVPFATVGWAAAGLALVSISGLFRPRAAITVSPAVLNPGGMVRIQWEVPRRRETMRRFAMDLDCTEEVLAADAEDGESPNEYSRMLYGLRVCSTTAPRYLLTGGVEFELPLHAPPTISDDHRTVRWSLSVTGMSTLPTAFNITVRPGEKSPGRRESFWKEPH